MTRKLLSKLAFALVTTVAAALPAVAAEGGFPLDAFPTKKMTEMPALQNGAKLFVNYCLNCHGASLVRYNRLQDLGLTEDQIKRNLLFTADKVGETMRTAMRPADAREWFGAVPPDLSVIARARASHAGSGADWLYTYLRSYYRDSTRATGWNNALFANVGMPHVLWELQGARGVVMEEVKEAKDEKTGKATGFVKTIVNFDERGVRTEKTEPVADYKGHGEHRVILGKPVGGSMNQAEYDDAIGDLVAYVTWMSDPTARTRTRLGVWVLLFLGVFTVIAWRLNAAFWKDVK